MPPKGVEPWHFGGHLSTHGRFRYSTKTYHTDRWAPALIQFTV